MYRVILRLAKWIVRIATALVVVVVLALSFFRAQAALRERKAASEVAPAGGRLVAVDGGGVFIQTRGPDDGIPVLFTHGMGAWSELWRSTLDTVGQAGFRAIAIDLPPFGFSDRPSNARYGSADQAARIIGVLDALGIQRAIFVGHSFGGGPTLEAALRRPDRVAALVLADPAVNFDESADGPGAVAALLSIRPLRNAILSATATNPSLTHYLMSQFVARKEAVSPERLTVLQRPLVVRGSTNALGDWLQAFLTPEIGLRTQTPSAYAAFNRPTLIIWGALDTTTPLEQGKRLEQLIRGSQLAVMDGIGHMPQIEDPAGFDRLLLPFIERFKR